MTTTLVTMVTSKGTGNNPSTDRNGSAIEMRDVLTRVHDHGPYHTIEFDGRTQGVEVKLSGAERIALIEALGGKA
jgi:hypothetical protein